MSSTTIEETGIGLIDLIVDILVIGAILGMLYVAFNVIHIKTPDSINGVLSGIGRANEIIDIPKRIGDIIDVI